MKKKTGCLLLVMAMAMTGCSKGDDVKKTTLYVDEDGEITEAIVETLDKDYYDSGEMENFIEEETAAYNKQAGDEKVEIAKCEVEDGKARVTMEYESMKEYGEFNSVTAFHGTVSEAKKAGYDFEGEFVSAKDKPSITYKELKGSKEYYVVIVEGEQTVILDEDVLYASPDVKVEGEKAIVENSDEKAYIIYKP